jgi:hypothetical protein
MFPHRKVGLMFGDVTGSGAVLMAGKATGRRTAFPLRTKNREQTKTTT